jgi:hypothetical protein
MRPSSVIVVAILAATACTACAASGHRDVAAARTTPRPVPVRTDGLLDADRVDLGGVRGVTSAEQHFAEHLLRETIRVLPHWSDVATARADGFTSIGDAVKGGDEHWVHWNWVEDNTILDPHRPESLVYHVDKNGARRLEAAMYMLPMRYRLDSLPDFGGALMQFHSHDDLCFSDATRPRFVRLAYLSNGIEACPGSLTLKFTNAMVHVWIRPNRCGPFAALPVLAPQTTQNGETQRCDEQHGNGSSHDSTGVAEHHHGGG